MLEDRQAVEEMTTALGEAVVACWSNLPHDIQQTLFEAAANDRNGFRGALALFLHDHNPRTANVGESAMPEDDDKPPLFPPGRP